MDQASEDHPNAYDSSGNSEAENAVKIVTGIMRTKKLDLEKHIKAVIPISHPLISWLAEYSAWMYNILQKGMDGFTSY